MKKKLLIGLISLLIGFPLYADKSEGNPFKKFGYHVEVGTFGDGEEFHDGKEIVEIGAVLYNTQTKEVIGLAEERDMRIELPVDIISTSIDPHCERYYSISPYAYCLNNPVRFIDPDGRDVYLHGSQAQLAYEELNKYVNGQINLTLNAETGQLCYTMGEGVEKLSSSVQQLVNAIDDGTIFVNVFAEDTKHTSTGNMYIGGAFMGNTVNADGTVTTRQEINMTVLSTMDKAVAVPGATTMHEVTESYQGGKIAQQTGISAPAASRAQEANPNSVYNQAHRAATPQPAIPNYEFYTARGIETRFVQNAARIDYYVGRHINKKVIMTYP